MIKRIFQEHKKPCIISGAILVLLLLAVYLYALLLPGFWLGETFLYKQDDGCFTGSDLYADYQMCITPTENGADISFSANETEKHYQIINDSSDSTVQIFENDKLVFQGNVLPMGDDYYVLRDENNNLEIDIQINTSGVPTIEELFPNYNWLYSCAAAEKYDTRGTPAMLFLIFFVAAILTLDIVFPDLFFTLNYRLAVDGGEPSDLYRFGQKIGRVLLAAAIVVCVVLSFTIH